MTQGKKPDMKKVLNYTIECLLRDEDVEIRRDAVCSLRGFKDKSSVVPILLDCMGDTDWRIRKTAVEVLLSIKNRTIIKALIKTLHSENANARNAAAEALVASGNEAVELLIETFVSSPPDVKKFIIDIIGTSGDMKVVELLLRAVDDEDDNIKATAIEYLGNLKSILAVDTLLSVLKRDNMWLNFYAVDALGKISGERATKALVALLHRKDLKKPVIKALGIIADADTLPLVVPFLKDDSKSVREETFLTIGRFYKKHVTAEEVTGILRKFFSDETESLFMPYFNSNKEEIKKTAVMLLALLKVKEAVAAIFDMYVDEDLLDTVKKTLTFIGSSSPELLMPFFSSDDAYHRRILSEVAGIVGDRVFIEPLISLLKDDDSHVRANSANALSMINDPEVVKHLKPLMLDQYEDIQEAAVRAMAVMKDGLDIDEITGHLSDSNLTMRKNSAKLLKLVGDRSAIEPLGIALKDSDVQVRLAVIEAIVAIDGEEAFKFLLLAITDEISDIRRIAALAMGKYPSRKSIDTLILLLHDPDTWVRAFAVQSLGIIKDSVAVNHLIKVLIDDSGIVRTSAIEALGNFREDRVKNVLLKLLSDKDAEIRSTAIESLSFFKGVAGNILPVLKDQNWAVRKKGVEVLGRAFIKESYSYLKEIADLDKDIEVRKAALRYLSV